MNPRAVLPHCRVLQPHLLVFTGEGLWGTAHVLRAELSAPKIIPASAAHLDVEGPGGRYDFKEVVSHQEVTRNRKRQSHPSSHRDQKNSVFTFISAAYRGGMH